jgi:signal transduction histidine kinase
MEPGPRSASLDELQPDSGSDASPFRRPGLLVRAGPFALVAVAAAASLALPPGTHAWTEVTVSLVLLAVVPLAFLLPWDRLPSWMPVLVPLVYTGSALALTLAAGTISGVGIVVLIPLIWTALFHRRWESACVVVAIVAAEIVVSLVQSAPGAVIVRRELLWAALGVLLAVATHGLRDRIRHSQDANARLQERIGELMVVEDRDRLAADLQGSVVQRIFAAGLKLQGAASQTAQPEVRRRVESSVTDLDDAIRLLRQAIFGLEHRLGPLSLRQQVLRLCADMSPVPEITFAGPVDEALLPAAEDQLADLLRVALGLIAPRAAQIFLRVEAGQDLRVVVTGTGPEPWPAGINGAGPDFAPLVDRGGQAGLEIEIEPVADGTQLAWSSPLRSSPSRRTLAEAADGR